MWLFSIFTSLLHYTPKFSANVGKAKHGEVGNLIDICQDISMNAFDTCLQLEKAVTTENKQKEWLHHDLTDFEHGPSCQ